MTDNMKALEAVISGVLTPGWQVFEIATDVPAGASVANGYGRSTAPAGNGCFDLFEVATKRNTHFCFVWMQAGKVIWSSRCLSLKW